MQTNKIILASTIGTLVEWAEFTFYSYMVYQFSQLFFPMLTKENALIAGFGVFAVSYLARPIGSLIFGYIGDTAGRQKALSISIILMSLTTLGMGLLPTYYSIGNMAPILLILLRFLQGAAMAGEFTGAAVFILEHTPNRPVFSSSLISTSSAAGMLIGSLCGIIVSFSFMPAWAWRIPFILGSAGALIGFYIRFKLSETLEYRNLSAQKAIEKTPLRTLFNHYKKPLLQTATLGAFVGTYIYVCNIWWVTHVIEKSYFSPIEARTLATIAQGSVVIFTFCVGYWAEKANLRKLISTGILGCTLITPFIFLISPLGSLYLSGMMAIVYAGFLAATTAPMFKYLKDLFPVKVRYTGQAVAWNFAVALYAGNAPLAAQFFSTHEIVYGATGYVMMAGIAAFVINFLFKDPVKAIDQVSSTKGTQ